MNCVGRRLLSAPEFLGSCSHLFCIWREGRVSYSVQRRIFKSCFHLFTIYSDRYGIITNTDDINSHI